MSSNTQARRNEHPVAPRFPVWAPDPSLPGSISSQKDYCKKLRKDMEELVQRGPIASIYKTFLPFLREDDEMLSHVEALYDFVVAYKKRLVPDYDPSAPVKKIQKDVDPEKLARRPHDFTSRSPRWRLRDDVCATSR